MIVEETARAHRGGADRLVRHNARERIIEGDRVREGTAQLRRPHAFILTLDPSSPRAIHSFELLDGLGFKAVLVPGHSALSNDSPTRRWSNVFGVWKLLSTFARSPTAGDWS